MSSVLIVGDEAKVFDLVKTDAGWRIAAESDVAQVTVLHESAARAEVLSKCALIAGAQRGRAMLESAQVRALMVTRDGSLQIVGDLECVCE